MTGWQPIKTAPKDGTQILGYWPPSTFHGGMHVGYIEGASWSPAYDDHHGWDMPTHWMPLPEAP